MSLTNKEKEIVKKGVDEVMQCYKSALIKCYDVLPDNASVENTIFSHVTYNVLFNIIATTSYQKEEEDFVKTIQYILTTLATDLIYNYPDGHKKHKLED